MLKNLLRLSSVVVLACLLVTPGARTQTNPSVEGMVKDAQTGDALPGANVILVGTSLGASADVNGKYGIRNVPPGSYTARATYVGYKTVETPVRVDQGVNLTHDFSLQAVGVEGETVVVTAQAIGQNEAINQQLAANQITSVVSSARIQELPDQNAAESVGRLPGVSIIRQGGEGTQVVVRGLEPKYNTVTVDGVRMASSNPNNRSADLSMISPYMLSGIEVTKTVTPDLDADVLGGSVNFKMRGATTTEREGLGVSLLAQAGYNGLSNAPNKYNNYKYVGSVDGRFLDNAFGVFAQADVERRNLTSNELGASYAAVRNSQIDYSTSTLNLSDIPRDRQRANGTLVLDYNLPQGNIRLTNFLSTGTTDAQNRGEAYNIPSNLHTFTFGYSWSKLNLITNALNVEQQLPVVHANLSLSHSYSETKAPGDWTVTFQQGPAGLSQFLNVANLNPQNIPGAASTDYSGSVLNALTTSNSFSRERALTAALDLDAPVTLSEEISAVVKFGGKFRYQTRTYEYEQFTGQGLAIQSAKNVDKLIGELFPSLAPYAVSTSIPMTAFRDPSFDYGKFLGGDYPMTVPLNHGMMALMTQYIQDHADVLAAQNDIAFFHDYFNSTTNNYDGHENQAAAYVMATINIGPQLTIIPGVRYQDLRTTYTAPQGQQNTGSATGRPYNYRDTTLTVGHGYWLPDVLVRVKPLDWLDVRLSYTSTIAYPDYRAIVPRIDVGIGGSPITYNNPRLTPSRSTNYDAYVSVYNNTIGLFTVGGFLKRITDLIFPTSFFVSGNAALPYYPPWLGATSSTGTSNVVTYINNPYRIDDYGMEFDWQTHFWYLPRPLDGLVLNVNYTHIFSKAQYPYTLAQSTGRVVTFIDTSYTERLLDQPNDIVNLSIGYDFGGFSARLSMLYTADVFTGSPGFFSQLATSTSAYTRWDLSVKQSLPWFGLQLFGDIYNLNGAKDVSVLAAPTGVPASQQSYGPTADLGIRWTY